MKNKMEWITNLRAFSTIAVIILHVSSPILYMYGEISNESWWVGNIYDGIVRFCVPVFLMITGAVMLSKNYTLSSFFKKRFTRIALPFFFWSFVYIIFYLIMHWQNGNELSVLEVLKITYSKLKSGASFHLWYIYMLIGIYLIFPIINKWIINATNTEIIYFLIVWVVVLILSSPIFNKFKPNIDFRYFTGYLGYVVLGYFLAHRFNYIKKSFIPIVSIIIGITLTIFGTYYYTNIYNKFYDSFYNYLSFNVVVTSFGVFMFLKNMKINTSYFKSTINFISKYSYGIYLCHVFVLLLLSKIGINENLINPLVGIPITTIVCLVISLFITYLLSRLPYGSYIAG